MTTQNKDPKNNSAGINPTAAAVVTGAIAGAGIAFALRSEESRENVKDALIEAKNKLVEATEKVVDLVSDKAEQAGEILADKVATGADKIQDNFNQVKEAIIDESTDSENRES